MGSLGFPSDNSLLYYIYDRLVQLQVRLYLLFNARHRRTPFFFFFFSFHHYENEKYKISYSTKWSAQWNKSLNIFELFFFSFQFAMVLCQFSPFFWFPKTNHYSLIFVFLLIQRNGCPTLSVFCFVFVFFLCCSFVVFFFFLCANFAVCLSLQSNFSSLPRLFVFLSPLFSVCAYVCVHRVFFFSSLLYYSVFFFLFFFFLF